MRTNTLLSAKAQNQWLHSYYYIRAAGSLVWITLAVLIGKNNPATGAVLLVLYPAWDAIANYLDASRSGGLSVNPPRNLTLSSACLSPLLLSGRSQSV